MKLVPLTRGRFTMVDDADFIMVSQHSWCCQGDGYPVTNVGRTPHRRTVLLSRMLLDAPKGYQVDHIDGNKLNNQRSNLRLCTNGQNQHNQRHRSPNKVSRFKGVDWRVSQGKWVARIQVDKRRIWLGYFSSEVDAARAYNKAAEKYFGEFAALNNIETASEVA